MEIEVATFILMALVLLVTGVPVKWVIMGLGLGLGLITS